MLGRVPAYATNPIAEFEDLMHQWRDLNDRWLKYLLQIDDSTVNRPVSKISISSGAGIRHVTPAIDVLLDVCTHSQYTIAQAINMLRHLGIVELPDTMLITMSRDTPDSPDGG